MIFGTPDKRVESKQPEYIKSTIAILVMAALIAAVLMPAFGMAEVPAQGFIALVTLATAVVSFYFGTTSNSSKKDDTIKSQAEKIAVDANRP